MSRKRKLVIVTQLNEKNSRDLIEYMEASCSCYGRALRETFYAVRRGCFNKSQYNTYLQYKYRISRRTANSIIFDAQGRFNSLKGLKEYERKQLKGKIKYLEDIVIPKLVEKRKQNSAKLSGGVSVLLVQQRNLRLKVVSKKSKLNNLKQRLNNLEYQLKSRKLRLCFGTKRLLKQDY